MKRIKLGTTYNTDTATLIAEIGGPPPRSRENRTIESLYQSRYGAFFLVRKDWHWVEHVGHQETTVLDPLTPSETRAWLEKNCPELTEGYFAVSAEMGAGEIKYTLRMPESLKRRLDVLAKHKGQSLNAWIIRCIESCASLQEAEYDKGLER